MLGSFDCGPGRPTVTVYNHLDVQPASKETEPWRTEPFEFTKQGDSYFGRGTTDDKGPALTALYGAKAALDAGVPVNIRFLWETGGGGRARRTSRRPEEDRAGRGHGRGGRLRHGLGLAPAPSLSSGLRGLQRFNFHLETAETDQHSGTTGGAARNPVAELAQLASEIFDARTGRVKIPGFYDDVAKLYEAGDSPTSRRRASACKRFMKRPRLQVDPHEGPARRDEAPVGAADVRGARPRRRLPAGRA